MATLEKRGNSFRIVFWLAGQRFSRSLKTRSEREAFAAQVRLEDNLRRYELGLLVPTEGTDLATFLLSDGRLTAKPAPPKVLRLGELLDAYLAAVSTGSLEASTVATMRLHANHLERIFGRARILDSLEGSDLQSYVDTRAQAAGMHGRLLSPTTVKRDLVTLRMAWNWAVHMGHLKRPFPNRGLRFGKLTEKPPFQTVAEIEKRISRGGLTKAEEADLWDSAFLTLANVDELLAHVRKAARQPFVYPLFVFAAHTGARRSEMLRSQVCDLDFESASVLIREKKRVRGKLSTRRVPLSPLLRSVLSEWLSVHPGGAHTFSHAADVERSKTPRGVPLPIATDEAHDHSSGRSKAAGFQGFVAGMCSATPSAPMLLPEESTSGSSTPGSGIRPRKWSRGIAT